MSHQVSDSARDLIWSWRSARAGSRRDTGSASMSASRQSRSVVPTVSTTMSVSVSWSIVKSASSSQRSDSGRRGADRFYSSWVRLATKRPLATIAAVIVGVGALSVPALDLRLGLPDAGSLESDSAPRQTYDLVADHFGPGHDGPLLVVGSTEGYADPVSLVGTLAEEPSVLESVAAVPVATPNEAGTAVLLTLIPTSAPDSEETSDLVTEVRDAAASMGREQDVTLSVTGPTAAAIDVSNLLSDALIPYVGFILTLSLILLTMVFRSVWVPLRATIGYLRTIASALGAVALVYSCIVRMTFVPAVMHILGDRAWSMPRWLERRLSSFDIEGERLTTALERNEIVHEDRAPGPLH